MEAANAAQADTGAVKQGSPRPRSPTVSPPTSPRWRPPTPGSPKRFSRPVRPRPTTGPRSRPMPSASSTRPPAATPRPPPT
ncbi:hypothetical protein ACFQZC_20915 [Streptacidiphilus monticola]